MTDFRIDSEYYLQKGKEPVWQRALLPPNEPDHKSSSVTAFRVFPEKKSSHYIHELGGKKKGKKGNH